MIIALNIDGIDREFEQTEDGRLTTVSPKTGWERGELMERYYTLDGASQPETYHPEDTERYNRADYFNSPALAADIARATELYRKLLRWQSEHDKPIIHGEDVWHFEIYDGQIVSINTEGANAAFDVLFTTRESAENALTVFYNDLYWFFTEFRPRLDA